MHSAQNRCRHSITVTGLLKKPRQTGQVISVDSCLTDTRIRAFGSSSIGMWRGLEWTSHRVRPMTSTGSSSHLEMGLNWAFGRWILLVLLLLMLSRRLPVGAAGVAASSAGSAGAAAATVAVSIILVMLEGVPPSSVGATAAVSVVDPPDASDIVIAVDGIVLR